MKITKLLPCGFCYGVKKSVEDTLNILKNNQDKKVYLLGWLVHNQNVINQLKQLHLILLDDSIKSRYDLIKELDDSINQDIIILSAHGTCNEAIKLAKDKGYQVIDLTCPFVYKTHKIIQLKLKQGYDVYFIGKKHHPETKAILSIDQNIHLISNLDDINNYEFKNKSFITNQTTLSIYEMQELIKAIKLKNEQVEFVNDICDATTKRQTALMNIEKDVDIILVLGDQKSSNSNELYKIALTKTPHAYLISNYLDLNLNWFKNKQHCLIVTAASCPESLSDEVINYLNDKLSCK